MTTIAADDPRADYPTYVAVCRSCGGWSYLCDGRTEDAQLKRDNKRAAAWCVDHGHDFKLMRYGDINLNSCECRKKPKQNHLDL